MVSTMSTSSTRPSRRILLVDDSEDSCELFQEVLEMEGHTVTSAHNGARALALLLEGSFEVAVIDIGLPDIDGYEVARRTRSELGERGPALVALTGFGGPSDRERAKAAGFDLHLVKPVDPSRLIEAVVGAKRT